MKIRDLVLPFFLVATSFSVADAAESPLAKIPLVDIDGKQTDLSVWNGYVVLIVNVASECGYTGQYEGLERIYQEYKGRGFTVMAFPCNDFGGQESASEKQIKTFCSSNFNVTFPLMGKVGIRNSPHPLFAALTSFSSPYPGPVFWNFSKFLIGRDGILKARFNSEVEPDSIQMRSAIEKALETAKR